MKKLVTVGPDNTTGFRKHIEEVALCYSGPAKFVPIHKLGPEQLADIQVENPDLTIIGGRNWIKRNRHILPQIPGKKGLLMVGPLGQNEISQIEVENFSYFWKLLNEGSYDYLFLGCNEFRQRLRDPRVIHLPAPFVSDIAPYVPKPFPESNVVAILNDKAPHKNTLNSIAGMSLSTKIEEFTTNGLSKEHAELVCLFGLSEKLRDVGKLDRPGFVKEIERSKLVLHLSYTEGLCYGALEALYRGTPVLVTNAMPWFYDPRIHVANPADHHEIAERIDGVLGMTRSEYADLSIACRNLSERKAQDNNRIVTETLQRLLDN